MKVEIVYFNPFELKLLWLKIESTASPRIARDDLINSAIPAKGQANVTTPVVELACPP